MHLACLTLLVFSALPVPEGEDTVPHAPFPSPRRSGAGAIPFTSNNVQLVGWKPLADFAGGNTSANDCWGYTSPSGREYAVIGLSNGTGFVEITDPGNPVIVDFESGPSSLWRAVKTHSTYAYAASEGGGGIQVFNLANIDSGVVTLANTVTTGGNTTATHTLAVDNTSGFLYRAGGGSTQGIVIYSLANPALPALVGSWMTRYVHECQVLTWDVPGPHFNKQIAFCYTEDGSGGGNPRLTILDVTNKGSITQMSSVPYTGGAFSHQGWVTPDRTLLYMNDELDDGSFGGARTRVFSLADLTAPVYLGNFPSGIVVPSIDHNLYIKGNRIYESNYRSGLRIFDRTATPTSPTVYGFFDSYPEDDLQDFNSLWSNYPFFASGTIIGSDIEKGLWVWREGAAKLTFDFPSGLPQFIGPGGGTVQFMVEENAPGDLVAGTVQFHYSTGGAFTTVNASALGGDLYQAALPAVACGSALQYYVSAESSDGVTWTDPPAGPTQVHNAVAAYGETVVFSDDFETNTGWSVNVAADLTGFTTAATGTWTRANPIGTSAQPEDDHTAAPGVNCFVTANGTVGGGLGDADVDSGATSLRSPVLDASGLADPYISYWRWFSNSAGSAPGEDTMTVHISNNGGSSWVLLETVGPTGADVTGGWIKHTARIADFVAPTNNLRLRFRVSDLVNGSIVEAAIDDLEIGDFDCTPPSVTVTSIAPALGGFDGGEIVTITGTGFGPGTAVSFGTSVASNVLVVNSTTLQVRVPRAPGARSGKTGQVAQVVDVVVSNPGSDTLQNAYTYQFPQKNR